MQTAEIDEKAFIPVSESEEQQTPERAHGETYFMRRGSVWQITDQVNLDLHQELPGGTYIVQADRNGNLYLQQVENFALPAKMYGKLTTDAERILNTYADRTGSTGVLLSGEKGSGKTLLAKQVSCRALEVGVPTIVVNAPFRGDVFNQMLQQIVQPCIVMFDEFEKVYDRDEQSELLTLLDGVFTTKKLFLFTCNDRYGINQHMTNRPGRIFYSMEFRGLEDSFIRDYCADNLKNQAHVEGVCRVATLFDQFNFDILQSMVQEMNRYGESPLEAMKYLNAKPESGTGGTYDIQLFVDDVLRTEEDGELAPSYLSGHPMRKTEWNINYYWTEVDGKESHPDESFVFGSDNMVSMNPAKGEYVFVRGRAKLICTRRKYADAAYTNAYSDYFE